MKRVFIWLLMLPCAAAAQVVDSCSQLVKDNKSWNYEIELKQYNAGRKNYAAMPFLVDNALEQQKDSLATAIAADYIDNYLMKQSGEKLWSKESLQFIRFNLRHSKSEAFKLVYELPSQVDSVLNERGVAGDIVQGIIEREEVAPLLATSNGEPEWEKIRKAIKEKYRPIDADKAVLNAQIAWYGQKGNWPSYCTCMTKKVDTYGPFGMFSDDIKYNEIAWDLFKHCSDTNVLNKALKYSGFAIKLSGYTSGEIFDTYANLLYKMGRREEAIYWQEKALQRTPELTDIRENLEKMKKGETTWPVNK